MRILVIGASGFIGRHLLRHATSEGHRCLGTAFRHPAPDLVTYDMTSGRLSDLLPPGFRDPAPASVAVITAAESRIDRCALDPANTKQLNVDGTVRLAAELNAIGYRVVFISTDYVFDGRLGHHHEGILPSPVTEYGRQKAETEALLLREWPGTAVVRLSRVVGSDPNERHIFAEWLRHIRSGTPIRCIRGQAFSPTDINDVAAGLLGVATEGLSGVWHLAGPESFTRAALARDFLAATCLAGSVAEEPVEAFGFREPRPLDTTLDGTRLTTRLGLSFTSISTVMERLRDGATR